MNTSSDHYDVAILGAGLAGAMLGAVLARNGVNVLLIDAGTHPRFAVGESTIPYTSTVTKIVAARYRVPEIEALSSFRNIQDKVTPMCGQKRNFGFVYHREGRPQDPAQTNQLIISERQGTETHLFRQDIDAYMFQVAVRYGAEPRTGTRVTDIKVEPDHGVLLRAQDGEEFSASYLVDAGGFRSPVTAAFGLREEPTRARAHSRALFTHMVGVTPFDQAPSAGAHSQPIPWHHGTLHHVFDGGWLWVIPFDNHDGARNGLCSVGLTLDERVYPKPDCPAQEEFDAFLRRFPDIAEQFTSAKAIRPWVSTDRLQYSSTRTVGDRYCLTAHAAGFIDALYSRGLTGTLEVVNALAWRLIEAARDGDWSTERFEYIDSMQQGLFDVHDDLVYSSFVGFRDYELWNAVLRVWKAVSILPTVTIQRALRAFGQSGDDQVFRDLEKTDTPGLPAPVGHDVTALLTFTRQTCEAVESGALPAGEAAERIFGYLRQAPCIPPTFELDNPASKFFEVTPAMLGRTREWAASQAPAHLADLFG
jgi:tetracycline 7-halogenase / FADH2 O2-dependent halogenase